MVAYDSKLVRRHLTKAAQRNLALDVTEVDLPLGRSKKNAEVFSIQGGVYQPLFGLKCVWLVILFLVLSFAIGWIMVQAFNKTDRVQAHEINPVLENHNDRGHDAAPQTPNAITYITKDKSFDQELMERVALEKDMVAPAVKVPKKSSAHAPSRKNQSPSRKAKPKPTLEDLSSSAQKAFQACKTWVMQGDVQKGVIECERAVELSNHAQAAVFIKEAEAKAKAFYIQGSAIESFDTSQAKSLYMRALQYAPSKSPWKTKAMQGLKVNQR